jgi:hypothetical protein
MKGGGGRGAESAENKDDIEFDFLLKIYSTCRESETMD